MSAAAHRFNSETLSVLWREKSMGDVLAKDVDEGAADRSHRLADLHLRGIPQRHGLERMVGRIDLDKTDVVVDVPADDLCRHPITVLKLDEKLVGGRNAAGAFTGVRDHV